MESFFHLNKVLKFGVLLVSIFLFQISVSFAVEKHNPSVASFPGIDFKDGQLKVSVEKQSFKEVMEDVANKSGIKIITNYLADEELTASFEYLPLEEGLKRLFKEKSYAFKYHSTEDDSAKSSSSLAKVFVFPKSEKHGKGGLRNDIQRVMSTKEIQNKIRQELDKTLMMQGFDKSNIIPEHQVDEALRKLDEMGGFDKLKNGETENQQFLTNVKNNIMDKLNIALEGMPVK